MKKRQTPLENISEATNRLDFVIAETRKILNHFENNKDTEPNLFCFIISERLNSASFGLKSIFKDFFSNTQLEYSCGIIIRSVLLDYMIVLNALIKVSESTDGKDAYTELNLFCSTMLSECVNHTLRDIEKLKFKKEDLKILYKNIAELYSGYLEPYNNEGDTPISKIKKSYSPGKLFEGIYKNKEFRQYSNVYEAYLFYSKYDHFGRMCYDFQNHDLEERAHRINESTKVFPKIIQYVITLLFILHGTDEVVKEQFENIQDYIRNH